MKQNAIYIIFVLMGSFFFACQEDPEWQGTEKDKVEIRFTTGINTQLTKAENPDTEIIHEQRVGIYIIENVNTTTADTIIAGNAQYESEGGGALTSVIDTVYYFPERNNVSVYAYHPYDVDLYHNNFSIEEDQSENDISGSKNFYNSDLLYAERDTFSRFDSPIALTFKHLLSKIACIVTNAGGGSTISVQLIDVITNTGFNLHAGLTSPTGGSQRENVTMHATYGAIIPPQEIPMDTKLLEITITQIGGGQMTYEYTTTSPIIFESGKKYEFNITVEDGDDIIITYGVSDWTVGAIDDNEGDVSALPD